MIKPGYVYDKHGSYHSKLIIKQLMKYAVGVLKK